MFRRLFLDQKRLSHRLFGEKQAFPDDERLFQTMLSYTSCCFSIIGGLYCLQFPTRQYMATQLRSDAEKHNRLFRARSWQTNKTKSDLGSQIQNRQILVDLGMMVSWILGLSIQLANSKAMETTTFTRSLFFMISAAVFHFMVSVIIVVPKLSRFLNLDQLQVDYQRLTGNMDAEQKQLDTIAKSYEQSTKDITNKTHIVQSMSYTAGALITKHIWDMRLCPVLYRISRGYAVGGSLIPGVPLMALGGYLVADPASYLFFSIRMGEVSANTTKAIEDTASLLRN